MYSSLDDTDTEITDLLYEIEGLQKELQNIVFMKDFLRIWVTLHTFIICKCSYLFYKQNSSSTLRTALHLLFIPYFVSMIEMYI